MLLSIAPKLPSSYAPLRTKYAHIKLCLDCSIKVFNVSVNVQVVVTVLLEYINLCVCNIAANLKILLIFTVFSQCFYTIPFFIMQNRLSYSFCNHQCTEIVPIMLEL